MKKVLSVKPWPQEMALEEVEMDKVSFWVQLWGVPLCYVSLENIKKLTREVGEFLSLEDPGKARGFLRVRIMVNTAKPLLIGCWIGRQLNRDTWVEVIYERLQDFCYRCGCIGLVVDDCSVEESRTEEAGFGEWTRAPPVRDEVEFVCPGSLRSGTRRKAGEVRTGGSMATSSNGESLLGTNQRLEETSGQIGEIGGSVDRRASKKWKQQVRSPISENLPYWPSPLGANLQGSYVDVEGGSTVSSRQI